ncbi:MAB_1171c family putative transporter [Dactylosporangium sp. CA-139066]|uniref:MAB_1171c family putative transporter n=1 Tax=Dactylosporangium sp. CA-139066 TaxID=3239930 RepID=UPI003D8EAB5B
MTIQDYTHVSVIAVVAVIAAHRFRTLRRKPDDLAARALFLGLACLEIVFLLGFPPVYWFTFRLLGRIPALPQLLQYATNMILMYQVEVFARAVMSPSGRRGTRGRRLLLLCGLAALFVTYLLGPWRLGLGTLSAHGHRDLGVAAFVLILQLYMDVVLINLVRLSWANRTVPRAYLRAGIRLIGIGCTFGLLYSGHKMIYYLASELGTSLPWAENGPTGVQELFLAPAVLSITAGVTIPALGPRVVRRNRRRRAYRQLRPLAAALSATIHPGATLPPQRGLDARLLHAVIGIRDAMIGPLRPYLRADAYQAGLDRAAAAGLPDDQARAVAEATCIAIALDDQKSNRPSLPETPGVPPFVHADNLDAEAHWLAQVSQAYTSSLVQTMLAERTQPIR